MDDLNGNPSAKEDYQREIAKEAYKASRAEEVPLHESLKREKAHPHETRSGASLNNPVDSNLNIHRPMGLEQPEMEDAVRQATGRGGERSEEDRVKQREYAKRKGNEGGMHFKKDMSDEV